MDKTFEPYVAGHYRDDIQGIRAIGAIVILIYHIWVHKVSGGVDVFFVISGFLMAGLLLRQQAREGKILPFVFWGKIVKRIAPAAYSVLIATLALSSFFILPLEWLSTANEFIASALHVENIQLIRVGADYLSQDNSPSPFQQFWALSIQVQFYFLLPLIIAPFAFISKKYRTIKPLIAISLAVFVLSFIYSLYATHHNPAAAYFNTGARAWEFFSGVLVAIALPFLRVNHVFSRFLSWLGLTLILVAGFLIPKDQNFPGFIALIPVLSAIFVIVAGANNEVKEHPNKFLANKYLAFFGSISFTIYLCHWPVLIFFQHHLGTTSLDLIQGAIVILLSFILAIFITRLIEKPLRNLPDKKIIRAYVIGFLFFAPTITAGVGTRTYINSLYSQAEPVEEFFSISPLKEEIGTQIENDASNVSWSEFLQARSDVADAYRAGCHVGETTSQVEKCEYGNTSSSRVAVLVGGSHIAQWQEAFSRIADSNGIKIIHMTKSSCSLGYMEWMDASCKEWNKNILEEIEQINPEFIITNSTRSDRFNNSTEVEFVPESYVKQWEEINSLGIPVLGVRDNPWFPQDPNDCLWHNIKNASHCGRLVEDVLLPINPADNFEQKIPGFYSLDFSEFFCTDTHCPVHIDGDLMWRDSHHLANSYLKAISSGVEETLEEETPFFE